jgi:Family of unknown function (DUF6011)
MAHTLYPATTRQTDYITILLAERDVEAHRREAIQERLDDGTMDRDYASSAITYLKARAKVTKVPFTPLAPAYNPDSALSCGMYRTPDGQIFRVHESKESGRLYAKVLVLSFDDDKPHFDYAKGAIYHLLPEHRMTLDEAKAWGCETGICCVCGAFLTDPKSVTEGIGPVCAKGF